MKKIKWVSYLLMILIAISSSCYALTIVPVEPSSKESIWRIIAIIVGIVIIPLLIYGILLKIMISRNKKETKKLKIRNSIFLLVFLMFFLVNILFVYTQIRHYVVVRYGYVDVDNQKLIEPKFEYAEEFYNGYAKIGYDFKYGFINKVGDTISQTVYSELSYFNESGNAYGRIGDDDGWGGSSDVKYYKIYQNGNRELITREEYNQNKNIEPGKQENDIKLKAKRIYNYADIFISLTIGMLSFIGIIKIIEKKDLQVNGGYDGENSKKEN